MSEAIATNRKAHFDYEILKEFEAGIVLLGQEVKALKIGYGNLTGAYVIIRGGEAWLVNFSLPPYQPKNTPADYQPDRARRLLLREEEIKELADKIHEGLTIVPLRVYTKGSRLKIAIALARGKKKGDKREAIKKRETEREMRRSIL